MSGIVERIEALVGLDTPSGDAERLQHAFALLAAWGDAALGRPGAIEMMEGIPHQRWQAPSMPHVLVLCHVDTIWPAGTAHTRPFRRAGGQLTGPGVFDMKAGIAIAMQALGEVAAPQRVSLLITGDEEAGSGTSRALIEASAAGSTAVLVLEPSLDGAFKTARKGVSLYTVRFVGRGAHAGLEPEAGRNALVPLARLVLACAELEDPLHGTTVTPTQADAGLSNNVVPEHAALTIDARSLDLHELERVDREIRAMCADGDGLSATVSGGINRPPLGRGASADLFERARQVARRLGMSDLAEASVGGASDGNFTAALGIPTLDGMGPVGGGAHTSAEWVEEASLADRARLLTGLIDDLTG